MYNSQQNTGTIQHFEKTRGGGGGVLFKHNRASEEDDYNTVAHRHCNTDESYPFVCGDEEAAAQAGTSCGTRQSLLARKVRGGGGSLQGRGTKHSASYNVPCHSAIALQHDSAVPWLRRLVTGSSPRGPGFKSHACQCATYGGECSTETHSPPSTSGFPFPHYPLMLPTHSFITDALPA
jgi:hypothetical protein